MRSNIILLLVMAAYFTVADIGYGIWSHLYFGAVEPIGTAAIGLLVILSLFIAFYLYSGMRRSVRITCCGLVADFYRAAIRGGCSGWIRI